MDGIDIAIPIRFSIRVVAMIAAMVLLLGTHVVLVYKATRGVPLRSTILRLGASSLGIALAWDIIASIIGATMIACCMGDEGNPVSIDQDFFFETMALPFNLCSRFSTLRALGDTFCYYSSLLALPVVLFALGLVIVTGTYLVRLVRGGRKPNAAM